MTESALVNCASNTFFDGPNTHKQELWLNELSQHTDERFRQLQLANSKVNIDTHERHANIISYLIASNLAGTFRLSPFMTASVGGRFSHHVVEKILAETALGQDLRASIQETKSDAFIESVPAKDRRSTMRRRFDSLLAGFVLSTSQATRLSNVSSASALGWIKYFYDEGRGTFRADLWKSDFTTASRCLCNLAAFFHRHYGDSTFATLVRNRRSDADTVRQLLHHKPDPDAEVRLKRWSEAATHWAASRRILNNRSDRAIKILFAFIEGEIISDNRYDPLTALTAALGPNTFLSYLRDTRVGAGMEEIAPDVLDIIKTVSRLCIYIKETNSSFFAKNAFVNLVSTQDIVFVENYLRSNVSGPGEHTPYIIPLPSYIVGVMEEILLEGEGGWPGAQKMCKAFVNGSEIYCPVLANFHLFRLSVPMRSAQTRRLDSGEGDFSVYNGLDNTWEDNIGINRGYWLSKIGNDEPRGYARQQGTPPVVGFYCNTNKSSDPFFIPWQNAAAHTYLHEVRVWQEAHNPIKSPITSDIYLDNIECAHPDAVAALPTIFPLFRMPPSVGRVATGAPPTYNMLYVFWQILMVEVERRINLSNPSEPISLFSREGIRQNGQPSSCIYSPHSLRSYGITRLFESGVPIGVIARFVSGHCVLQALAYMRYTFEEINSRLEAAQTVSASKMASVMAKLRSGDDAYIRECVTSLQSEGLKTALSMSGCYRSLWTDVELGFCLFQAARCHDGYEIPARDQTKKRGSARFGAVPGGRSNCVVCRHFITGPDWELGLVGYSHKLSFELSARSKEYATFSDEADSLLRTIRDTAASHPETIPAVRRRLGRVEAKLQITVFAMETVAVSLFHTGKLLKSIHKIEKANDDISGDVTLKTAIIVSPNSSPDDWVEISKFENAATVMTFALYYPTFDNGSAEHHCSRFVDLALHQSGIEPISLREISDKEKSHMLQKFVNMLMRRMSRDQLLALERGSLRLKDLPLSVEIDQCLEISIKGAVGPYIVAEGSIS